MNKLRVIIADSQPDVCYALRVLLQLVRELKAEVLAETNEAGELARQIRKHQPDLLLIDWALDGLPSRDRLAALRGLHPPMCIIVLSNQPELRAEALRAGADEFVSKVSGVEPVIAAIRSVRAARR